MSDGADYGSITDLDAALEEAQRADTVIYSMYYATPSRAGIALGRRGGGRMPRVLRAAPDGKKVLKKLSEETGGRVFEITGKLTVTEIFRQIQEELRSQYILGFTPPAGFASKAFRRITLRAKDKRLKVFCRSGYYPQPKPEVRDSADVRALESAGWPVESAIPAAASKDPSLTPGRLRCVPCRIKLGADLVPPAGISRYVPGAEQRRLQPDRGYAAGASSS